MVQPPKGRAKDRVDEKGVNLLGCSEDPKDVGGAVDEVGNCGAENK